jgi:hypothetical protein
MIYDAIRNYLGNREEFYATLLPRIPHETLRTRLQAAVDAMSSQPTILEAAHQLQGEQDSDELLSALELRDLLKKVGFGALYGRTCISFEEALSRAELVEETGALLFEQSAAITGLSAFGQEASDRRQALATLLRLGDSLRYRKP